jgi:hypothetical protein
MVTKPPGPDGDARMSLHQAIDYLTAALLDVQQLRRHVDGAVEPERIADDLHRLEETLQALGTCLLQLRDTPS